MKPHIVEVSRSPGSPGFYVVGPVFLGVDRPYTGGVSVPAELLQRTIMAFLSGAATPNPRVVRDVTGASYVSYDSVLHGRYLNTALLSLGF